jgi:hypothetical protein
VTCGLELTFEAHGWGAAAAYALPAHVVGIRPLKPNFEMFAIVPTLLGLSSASAMVPTVSGTIRAAWSLKEGVIDISVEAPPGLEGIVDLSRLGEVSRLLKVDGKAIGPELSRDILPLAFRGKIEVTASVGSQ